MNFLSHYYFERFVQEPDRVMGALLPDLLKNVDKSYSYQLHKYSDTLSFHPKAILITEGWNRHIEIDKLFHSSAFFYTHTHTLRKQIEYIVADSPIRASFLAHISLELLLDHLLITHNMVNVERLYDHLESIDRTVLSKYLTSLDKNVNLDKFFRFYDRFVEARYIFEYSAIENIAHALYNICKRVWQFTPTSDHIAELTRQLTQYQEENLHDYKGIYTFIQDKIA